MRKDNSKQLPVKSVSAVVVDSPDNPTWPRDKVFKIMNAPTLEEYPSLKAAATAAGVGKNTLSRAIFYLNKLKGRYWIYASIRDD
ncbi:hypothetical protein NIES4075_63520 [Tolypothrix sp. NIES-4075]|uniref:hypothetical protein n=1 Tax=Tolypothrix sp. NIES-4075 TaxID=2005459 RepID=UPI000B5CE0ED|nr:hypothetical protein [Tolypothrix sp. NIES-4075]GAX45331.1 hypothetical protein NIES4075_63520 [Tolypothrix sp. NIES-4075]